MLVRQTGPGRVSIPTAAVCALLVLSAITVPAYSGWQSFQVEQGLSHNSVLDILEDHRGHLWFGTEEGLTHYDGFNWRTLRQVDGQELGLVRFLVEDLEHNLWFGSRLGAIRYDGHVATIFTSENGLPGDQLTAIEVDRAGNVWVGTDAGAARYDGNTWVSFAAELGLRSVAVKRIFVDRAGNVWVGTEAGVARHDGNAWVSFSDELGLGPAGVTAIFEDRAGTIWIATGAGVAKYEAGTWTTLTKADGLLGLHASSMAEAPDGALWIGTEVGLNRYLNGSFDALVFDDTYPHVGGLLADSRGNVWFGLAYAVGRFVSETFDFSSPDIVYFDAEDGLPPRFAPGMCGACIFPGLIAEDGAGNIWVAVANGLGRFDGVRWRTYGTAQGLPTERSPLYEDRTGRMWAWSSEGLAIRTGNQWTRVVPKLQGIGSSFASMLEDRQGRLWFSVRAESGIPGRLIRYDRTTWVDLLTEAGELEHGKLLEDRLGNIWVAAVVQGSDGVQRLEIGRHEGSEWTWFATDVGPLNSNSGPDYIFEDGSGNIWVIARVAHDGVEYHPRIGRYDGSAWTWWTPDDGLLDSSVISVAEDAQGNVWFGTLNGAYRFDGTSFVEEPRLSRQQRVGSILLDRQNRLWFAVFGDPVFGRPGAVYRLDGGGSWSEFGEADDLKWGAHALMEDHQGNIWAGTPIGGVRRYDGVRWLGLTQEDGLANNSVTSILVDRSGSLWFGTRSGLSLYEPDRTPPQTVIPAMPPLITTATSVTVTFTAAFGELQGIEHSHSFDGGPWSGWSPVSAWTGSGFKDGSHTFLVRSRDLFGNVDGSPASFVFEVDATPPTPIIASPTFGEPVRGRTTITGTAADPRFSEYRLDALPPGATTWSPLGPPSTSQVVNGTLGTWDTVALADGNYDLRLSVDDHLGLTGVARITVVVDNEAPFVEETSPARVSVAMGGDIYTTNRELHLFFPPRAFDHDAVVQVGPLEQSDVPDALPDQARRVLTGYSVSWGSSRLEKAAILELSIAGVEPSLVSMDLALYHSDETGTWQRLGGSVDHEQRLIATPIGAPGRVALFVGGSPRAAERLSVVSLNPRVFSPRGTFASSRVAISFALGRPQRCVVKVFNRAGRLTRTVETDFAGQAGYNVLYWDGLSSDGSVVPDGLYLVTVQAGGATQTSTVAVVK